MSVGCSAYSSRAVLERLLTGNNLDRWLSLTPAFDDVKAQTSANDAYQHGLSSLSGRKPEVVPTSIRWSFDPGIGPKRGVL